VEHDLAVAHIVSDLGLDTPTICAAMLHDCLLPHSSVGEKDIRKQLGPEIAGLVTSLSKLDMYTDSADRSRNDRALESIRRALLSVIEGEPRIIIVYLADRLQELRKAGELTDLQRQALAFEAQNIHAPLANRLGIWQIKWELEDLAFRFLEPEQYRLIAANVAEKREDRNRRIDEARRLLQRRLDEANIEAEVTGRPKHIYSIYRKMVEKGVRFDELFDIRALRVIVKQDDSALCYQVLAIVHNLWTPLNKEFDDYIARPKANGYQSLHTAVMDGRGQILEVQIRTRAMHEEAEKGIAAHWTYKEGGRAPAAVSQQINSLRQLLTTLKETDGAYVDSSALRNELFGERIFVFTPKGDVIDLPAGATPIDFAYAIHTEVGHRCRGALVNAKMVGLDYRLKSGEKIEIITANKGGPSRDWMNESLGYTGSSRTRSKIRGWFRQQDRDKNIAIGRDVVSRELRRLGVADVYTIRDIAEALKHSDQDLFLARVGFGDIQSTQIGGAIAALQQKLKPDDELRPLLKGQESRSEKLTVKGIGGLHTKMAACCSPIPPEPIMGYITRGRGITIHTRDCKQLLATREPERWIEVEWGLEGATFPIPIVVTAYRRTGLIEDISNLLKGANVSVTKTKTVTASNLITVSLIAQVATLDQLNWTLSKLEKVPNVIEARRQKWAD
jgi:GTP pyrophosphokinase